MNVTFGVLANYANVTREGTLNIMGIFENLRVRSLPATHNERLVLRLEAQFAERDRPHEVEIVLQRPDGPALRNSARNWCQRVESPAQQLA